MRYRRNESLAEAIKRIALAWTKRELGASAELVGADASLIKLRLADAKLAERLSKALEAQNISVARSGADVQFTTPPSMLYAASEAIGALFDCELVALMINSKDRRLYAAYALAPQSVLIGRPVVSRTLDIGDSRRAYTTRGDTRARHSADIFGLGWFDDSERIPKGSEQGARVHTLYGVSSRGVGLGTMLYTGLAVAAVVAHGFPFIGSVDGDDEAYISRKEPATKWWRAAEAIGYANDLTIEVGGGEGEEDCDNEYSFSGQLDPDAVESDVKDEVYDYEQRNVTSVKLPRWVDVTFDVSYCTEGESTDTKEFEAQTLDLRDVVGDGKLLLWCGAFHQTYRGWGTSGMSVQDFADFMDDLPLEIVASVDPNTDDPVILEFVRNVLLYKHLAPELLAEWEATYGLGGRGALPLDKRWEKTRNQHRDTPEITSDDDAGVFVPIKSPGPLPSLDARQEPLPLVANARRRAERLRRNPEGPAFAAEAPAYVDSDDVEKAWAQYAPFDELP